MVVLEYNIPSTKTTPGRGIVSLRHIPISTVRYHPIDDVRSISHQSTMYKTTYLSLNFSASSKLNHDARSLDGFSLSFMACHVVKSARRILEIINESIMDSIGFRKEAVNDLPRYLCR